MTDEAIVALYWERNETAIARSDEKYGPYCRSVSFGILRDRRDAEECVNDTWMSAWNAMPPHKPSKLQFFLGKLTRNLSINRLELRRAKKRGGGELPLVLSELEGCLPDSGSVEEAAEGKELAAFLSQFVHELPEAKRRVFIRRYWYLSSVADIAREYGMSEAKVTSMLDRMREKLRAALEKEGYGL